MRFAFLLAMFLGLSSPALARATGEGPIVKTSAPAPVPDELRHPPLDLAAEMRAEVAREARTRPKAKRHVRKSPIDPVAGLRLKKADPFSKPMVAGGLLAMLLVAVVDAFARRRLAPAAPALDFDFEDRTMVIVATTPAQPAFEAARADAAGPDILDPLRFFHPDAPPVPPIAVERGRPDYIRVDDPLEVWTPSHVAAARTPATSARRRRADAPGADYRFHRLNPDGSVKVAERRKFVTDLDAQQFAETLGRGDAVEVWLGERRLATIPPAYFA